MLGVTLGLCGRGPLVPGTLWKEQPVTSEEALGTRPGPPGVNGGTVTTTVVDSGLPVHPARL